jgi:hypothetical protein
VPPTLILSLVEAKWKSYRASGFSKDKAWIFEKYFWTTVASCSSSRLPINLNSSLDSTFQNLNNAYTPNVLFSDNGEILHVLLTSFKVPKSHLFFTVLSFQSWFSVHAQASLCSWEMSHHSDTSI